MFFIVKHKFLGWNWSGQKGHISVNQFSEGLVFDFWTFTTWLLIPSHFLPIVEDKEYLITVVTANLKTNYITFLSQEKTTCFIIWCKVYISNDVISINIQSHSG